MYIILKRGHTTPSDRGDGLHLASINPRVRATSNRRPRNRIIPWQRRQRPRQPHILHRRRDIWNLTARRARTAINIQRAIRIINAIRANAGRESVLKPGLVRPAVDEVTV
jgi:hypothetical protein